LTNILGCFREKIFATNLFHAHLGRKQTNYVKVKTEQKKMKKKQKTTNTCCIDGLSLHVTVRGIYKSMFTLRKIA